MLKIVLLILLGLLHSLTSHKCLNYVVLSVFIHIPTVRYHMYGDSIDTLNVFANRANTSSGQLGSLIWTRSGGQYFKWYKALVTTNYTRPFASQLHLGSVNTNSPSTMLRDA